jgi:2-polyprenyl-3-methyl-5-hydroxy-6-metoxy-1,4-benzoquinol methylase
MPEKDYLQVSKEYYNNRFGNFNATLSEDEKLRWEIISDAISKHIAKKKSSKLEILDFGCGRGWLSNNLTIFGKVTGVDLAEAAIESAKVNYPGIEFICLDASSGALTGLNKKFDIAVSSEVIEHVSDQNLYFQNLASYIRQDGLLVLTTPNGRWINEWFAGERNSYRQPFEFWLSEGALANLAKKDFRSIDIKSFYSEWLFFFKSAVSKKLFTMTVTRRIAMVLGVYRMWIDWLNKHNYGLYLLLTAARN